MKLHIPIGKPFATKITIDRTESQLHAGRRQWNRLNTGTIWL